MGLIKNLASGASPAHPPESGVNEVKTRLKQQQKKELAVVCEELEIII